MHEYIDDLQRPVGTHLYGRRMWETMRFWETAPAEDSAPGRFGALWRSADKVVFSRTLEHADTDRTRLERSFDPASVRDLKDGASAPLTIGGARLAAEAMRAGLVDRLDLVIVPVVIGSGPRALADDVGLRLALTGEHRFADGWVHLSYAVGGTP